MAARMAELPGFFLQQGDFTVGQRAACFFSKAVQFSCVGSLTSSVGQFCTKSLVDMRIKLDPTNKPEVELAPVLPTAAAYAVFMGASSNTRYQVVNSLEAYGLPLVPGGPGVQTVVSSVVRTLNNVRAHAADATDTLPLTGSSTIH